MKNIKILWTGCPNCIALENNVKIALEKSGIEAKIEHITDIAEIMAYWVMWTPWFVVDEKVISSWKVLDVDEIISLLDWNNEKKTSCCSSNKKEETKKESTCCSSKKEQKSSCCSSDKKDEIKKESACCSTQKEEKTSCCSSDKKNEAKSWESCGKWGCCIIWAFKKLFNKVFKK